MFPGNTQGREAGAASVSLCVKKKSGQDESRKRNKSAAETRVLSTGSSAANKPHPVSLAVLSSAFVNTRTILNGKDFFSFPAPF